MQLQTCTQKDKISKIGKCNSVIFSITHHNQKLHAKVLIGKQNVPSNINVEIYQGWIEALHIKYINRLSQSAWKSLFFSDKWD